MLIVDGLIDSNNCETSTKKLFNFDTRSKQSHAIEKHVHYFISSLLIAEPSSRDPMVESTTSGSSSDTNGPVCAQLLTQLNTAYQHLAPDAQALVSFQ